tara:strand:+ start:1161 stop:2189 length:1029 start_codon:yes stop_codon:yes gene_type:complete
MFKRLDPTDVDKTPFKVYKQFSLTEADSGSFVYNFRAISGSHRNYIPLTADKTTFHNNGDIIGKTMEFHTVPAWFMINNRYYRQKGPGARRSFASINPWNNFASNQSEQYRLLQKSASIISVPNELYGERIKPRSVELEDDSTSATVTIVDDGKGNLYDKNLSSSFALFASGGFADADIEHSTASFAGNIFYEQGVLVFTNTGSNFINVGTGKGSDGFLLKYKAQVTLNEYSYTCISGENEFNSTANISATFERSGSITTTGDNSWRFFPIGDAVRKSGSYGNSFTAATKYEAFVTHSDFAPYVTKVGLYNDFDELLAVGQLSAPIKNDKNLSLGFVVRFDA